MGVVGVYLCTLSVRPPPINGTPTETVSARELHTFLESKQQFSTWVKNRISDYDFVENQDFVCVSQKNETQRTDLQIRESGSIIYTTRFATVVEHR